MNKKRNLLLFAIVTLVIILIVLISTSIFSKERINYKNSVTQFSVGDMVREISHGDTSKKQVIFTFDGGGGIQSADKILEVLAKHNVKGTFFLTGKMVETNPDVVKRIAAGNNEIFNHTFDHPYLTTLSGEKIGEELSKMESALLTLTNISPKPFFRAPYGERNDAVIAAAASAGYRSVFWTVDALDWKETEGETAETVKQRILDNVAPGTIYLMHVGDDITGEVLDDVFNTIEKRGYKIVSLTEGI